MSVSVVIATYNGEKYILEQLDSIRLQSMIPDEVIIHDDCSSDHTVSLINDYISKHQLNTWRVIVNEHNMGYAENFKHLCDSVQDDFVLLSDQDDIWENRKIEIMVNYLREHDDCHLICSDYAPFSDDNYQLSVPSSVIKRMPNDGSIEKIELVNRKFYLKTLGCCMAFKKEYIDAIADYDFQGWAHDDRLWKLALCTHGCYFIHSNLTRHRIHNNNTATFGKYRTKSKRVAHYYDTLKSAEQMKSFMLMHKAHDSEIILITKYEKMMKLRINLIEKWHLWNAIPLLAYLPMYIESRAWLVDLYVAVFGKP